MIISLQVDFSQRHSLQNDVMILGSTPARNNLHQVLPTILGIPLGSPSGSVPIFPQPDMIGSAFVCVYNIFTYVTGSGKRDILEQMFILSNSQIYGLQYNNHKIFLSWLIGIYSHCTTSLQNLML